MFKMNKEFYTDWLIIKNLKIPKLEKEINKHILNLRKIDVSERSTRGNQSKQYNLFEFLKNKNIKSIKKTIINSFNQRFNNKINLNLLNAWTVLGQKGSYHILHRHNSCENIHIASVLYLNVPKKSSNEEGCFYFCFRQKNEIVPYYHKPKKGDLLIFPIWLWHGSYPQNKGLRQTLNLDFKINLV